MVEGTVNLTQAQAARFYETLARLIGEREGVSIKVLSVEPRKEKVAEIRARERVLGGAG